MHLYFINCRFVTVILQSVTAIYGALVCSTAVFRIENYEIRSVSVMYQQKDRMKRWINLQIGFL